MIIVLLIICIVLKQLLVIKDGGFHYQKNFANLAIALLHPSYPGRSEEIFCRLSVQIIHKMFA